jgi:hypothetical protein
MSDDHNHMPDPIEREQIEPPPQRPAPEAIAVEVSMLARAKDPSLAEPAEVVESEGTEVEATAKKRAGVAWVRPSELLAAATASWAGRGVDLGGGMNRKARTGAGNAAKATGRGVSRVAVSLSERAKRLPPASAFGRRGGSHEFTPVSRRGIARIR